MKRFFCTIIAIILAITCLFTFVGCSKKDGEYSADGVWSTNIFGKTLGDMMEDGIRDKISKMDDECQTQLQNTMQKIVNDNNGGLVCIII